MKGYYKGYWYSISVCIPLQGLCLGLGPNEIVSSSFAVCYNYLNNSINDKFKMILKIKNKFFLPPS